MSTGTLFKANIAFVPANGNGNDAKSQKFIRGHAMRETLRYKALGVRLNDASHHVVPYQTGRYRVGTETFLHQTEAKSKAARVPHAGELPPTVSHSGRFHGGERYDLIQDAAQYFGRLLPLNPSQGRLDPFNSPPIKLGRQQQMLLSYYGTSFTQNDLAFNGNRKMMSIASSDPAWLHTTFALVALSHGFSTGIVDGVSLECLFHRGQALQMVTQRLHDSATNITESTIGAITSLANIELTIGSLLTCTAHMRGVEHLLKIRGWSSPREIPKEASFLRKLVAWSDLAYAGVTLSKPRFPPLEVVRQTSLVEAYWDEDTSLPVTQVDMYDILNNIRCLSQFLDRRSLSDNERKYFESTIFSTQYQLLVLNGNKSFDEVVNADTSLLYQSGTRIALCVYINMVLRKLPHRAILHSLMAKHMKSDLEKTGNLIFNWSSNLELLLWILFMGSTATNGRTEHSFFVRNLVLVVIELQISSLDAFIKTLELTAWSKAFCLAQGTLLWQEINGSSFLGQHFLDQLTREMMYGLEFPLLV